ncbi:hypothetical protein LCGC14_1372950 [marine sediment metagenome]|uniref:Uncharacterized protein n=1 Tax=marine sediment metagenome TaxID=412755 RepID=A0A0F9MK55_9ZZZZ
MSHYIYTHPGEAYLDEIKVITKTCKRRKLSDWTLGFLLLKALLTYGYRYVRLLVKPK